MRQPLCSLLAHARDVVKDITTRHGIDFSNPAIAAFCRRRFIRRLSAFGSVLREDFGPESDVDILVEFEPGRKPGLAFFTMQEELSRILGRTVDLQTPEFLSEHFRAQVIAEAVDQFELCPKARASVNFGYASQTNGAASVKIRPSRSTERSR